jgi:hypothetical protein
MKRVIGLVLLLFLVASPPSGAVETRSPSTPTPSEIAPGVYTYDEVVKLGLSVSPLPEELGYPPCDLSIPDEGLVEDEVVPDKELLLRRGPQGCLVWIELASSPRELPLERIPNQRLGFHRREG